MAQVTIHVPPRPYQARIENGLLTRSGALLAELLPQSSKLFVITAAPIRRRWGAKLLSSLTAAGFKPHVLQLPDGEPAKRLATIETLAEKLVRLGADRKAVLIALGGGVVGDVTLYARRRSRPDSNHGLGAGRRIRRRQNRCKSGGREEPARNLSPSARRADRSRSSAHALPARLSLWTLRSSQVRHHRRSRSLPALRTEASADPQTRLRRSGRTDRSQCEAESRNRFRRRTRRRLAPCAESRPHYRPRARS